MEMARRLIAGEKPIDIARAMNITPGRLSIICQSPAFQAHLARLRGQADACAADVQGRLRAVSEDSMTLLEQAIRGPMAKGKIDLSEEVKGLSVMQRVSIAQDAMSRAGYGPVQKSMQASLALTGDDIDGIKRRRDEARLVGASSTAPAK